MRIHASIQYNGGFLADITLKKSGSIAYRATSGRLAHRGTEK